MVPPHLMVTIKNRAVLTRQAGLKDAAWPAVWSVAPWLGLIFLKNVGLSLALVGLLVLVPGCMPAGPRALLDGKRLIEQGKSTQAVDQLKTATSLLPTNAQAWNYLGLAYHYAGQVVEAEKAYQRALALDHNLFEAHYNFGCLLLTQNKTNLARNELTAFSLRRPNSVDGLLKLGLAQLRCRELAAAEKSFNDAWRLNPHSAEALNGLGLTRAARNHGGDAAIFFHRALKENPGYRPALLNLAIVSHQYLKKQQFALEKYREYLALKPADPQAAAVKILVQQLDQEVNAALRPALSNPTAAPATPPPTLPNPAASNLAPRTLNSPRAQIPTNTPKPIPAIEPAVSPAPIVPPPAPELVKLSEEPVFRPAQDIQPATTPSPPTIVDTEPQIAVTSTPSITVLEEKPAKRSFLQRVNPLNAFRNSEKPPTTPTPLPSERPAQGDEPAQPQGTSFETEPESTVSNWSRYAYSVPAKPLGGNRKEAEPAFRQGVELQQARKWIEAIQSYEQATKLDPSFFEAHYNLGLATSGMGNLAAALKAYEMALAIQPGSVDSRYNFALTLKQANYIPDAIHELERLVASKPQETRAYLALGNLYAQQMQQPVKARRYYVKVLELDPRHPQSSAIRFWLAANPQ